MLIFHFGLLYCAFHSLCHALPTKANTPQTAFYLEQTQPFESKSQDPSREYTLYTEVIQYYEHLVDSALNDQSEDLFLNLIYMPTETKCQLLEAQAQFLGIDQAMSKKQLLKIPMIIGRHIQAMNVQVYQSIEPIIERYWKTLSQDIPEGDFTRLLASLNSVLASRLIDEIDSYMLVEQVQQDIDKVLEQKTNSWLAQPLFSVLRYFYRARNTSRVLALIDQEEMQVDFLRQYLANVRIRLLTELHVQFMDFFVRMKTDVIEQLTGYYNEP